MTAVHAEYPNRDSADRVRRSTAAHVNSEIDRHTDDSIRQYAGSSREAIMERIGELDRVWDCDRVLVFYASSLALSGLV